MALAADNAGAGLVGEASAESELKAGSIERIGGTDYAESASTGRSASASGSVSGVSGFQGSRDISGKGTTILVDDRRTPKASYAVFPYIPNPTTKAFIRSIAEDARAIGQKDNIYASVMIAQAILESGSGSSGLSKPPYHNLFGIKGSYRGASVSMWTSEDDGSGSSYDIVSSFRRYPSVRASLADYADLIRRSMGAFYAPVWKENARTYVQACKYLQGHYATDTTYASKLRGIIVAYDLTEYDYPAKKAPAKKDADEQRALEMLQALSFDGAYVTSMAVLSHVNDSMANEASENRDTATDSKVRSVTAADVVQDDEPERLPAAPVAAASVALILAGLSVGFVAKGGAASLLAAIKSGIAR